MHNTCHEGCELLFRGEKLPREGCNLDKIYSTYHTDTMVVQFIERIMVLCFVNRLILLKNTTFRKLDVFPSSGKILAAYNLWGPLERAVIVASRV
jgi:hypothetical protein